MDNNRLPWLDPRDPDQAFPPVERAFRQPNGLLAVGGDLSTTRLLRAYSQGIFPWYNPEEPILWWSPDPRCVFLPGGLHVSRRLQRDLARNDYAVSLDRAFDAVITACAAPRPDQPGTWLGPQMQAAYRRLHQLGHAHSVEVWREGKLVGGLYGVALGGVFFGESMFSRATNGSKLALVWLIRQLEAWNYPLFDCQVGSPHLYRLGATDLPRPEFLVRLKAALTLPGRPGRWNFDLPTPADPRHLP